MVFNSGVNLFKKDFEHALCRACVTITGLSPRRGGTWSVVNPFAIIDTSKNDYSK
jgi:hypothetical protein